MAKNNYVSPTLTGYNANPPADDGTQTEANRVKWDTVKTKIGDPLNTYSSAIDSAIDAALDTLPNNSTTSQATNFTVATTDDGKVFKVTGNSTATLPSAATAGAGFQVTIKKDEAANTVTVSPDGSDTIDNETSNTIDAAFEGRTYVSDGSSEWSIVSDVRRDIPLPPEFLQGYELAINGTDSNHDIDVEAGSARDVDDGGNIVLTSTLVKEIDATFVEGTNQGGLDTGTVAASTKYYIWAIAKSDDLTSDALFSLSKTSPTMPSGFDLKRLVGYVVTDSASDLDGRIGQVNYDGSVSEKFTVSSVASYSADWDNGDNWNDIELQFTDLLPATDNTQLQCRTSTDGGGTFDSGASDYSSRAGIFTGSYTGIGSTAAAQLNLTGSGTSGLGNVSGDEASGTIKLINPRDAVPVGIDWGVQSQNGGTIQYFKGGGKCEADSDVDGIQIFLNSGNISTGTFTLTLRK